MFVRATITGNLREALQQEVRVVSAGLRRAVATTAQVVQSELRSQARAAGFRDGGRAVANAWRLRVYPNAGVETFHPTAQVVSRVPSIVEAFDRGIAITARKGRYLAFPTGYNASGGRRQGASRGGLRITPDQMRAARGEAFVIPTSNPRVKLWCLRVREGRGLSRRGRNRVRLWAGGAEVLTGRRKGQQQGVRDALNRGFVPMFFLMKAVHPRKRLNIAQVESLAATVLAGALERELRV